MIYRFWQVALTVLVVVLALALISTGMMMLDKPSNTLPLAGIFISILGLGLSLWVIRLIWRNDEKKTDVAVPSSTPVDDASVREPDRPRPRGDRS